MADNNTIARPYARAAFEVAEESGRLGPWSEALETAAAFLADGTVEKFLANPALSDDERLEFLSGLMKSAGSEAAVLDGSDRAGTNFLKLLLEYGRVGALPEIAEHFARLKAGIENTVDVTITAAVPLSDEQQRNIAAALQSKLGREVRLQTVTDENLIGGAVIRAGDVVIDGSLKTRLDALSHALVA